MDQTAPLKLDKGKLRLRVLTDRQSVEIYANDGRIYMPMNGRLDLAKRDFALAATGDGATLLSATAFELNSIWK
ncbi:MAG: GH32 C-terminal domain-containing protein [Verrucomicrobia bacterium]|nr:GH32 C-terminal domain-containing protein [Verrucomicrobiota bacterium]